MHPIKTGARCKRTDVRVCDVYTMYNIPNFPPSIVNSGLGLSAIGICRKPLSNDTTTPTKHPHNWHLRCFYRVVVMLLAQRMCMIGPDVDL